MNPGHVEQQHPTPTLPPTFLPGTQPEDVSDILSDDALTRLRRSYDKMPHQMVETSRSSISAMYSRSSQFLEGITFEFFRHEGFAEDQEFKKFARDREQIVIALLAARVGNRRIYLALHFYWGLMVGLSPEEIARRLLFISFYSGIDTLTSSLETLSLVLSKLRELTNQAMSDDALAPKAIMGELKKVFP